MLYLRESKMERKRLTTMISFKVPDGLNDKIVNYCDKNNCSISYFMRMCCETFFQRQQEYAKISTTLRPKITESFLDFLLRARAQSFEAQRRGT